VDVIGLRKRASAGKVEMAGLASTDQAFAAA
jgi:hypothetical protein